MIIISNLKHFAIICLSGLLLVELCQASYLPLKNLSQNDVFKKHGLRLTRVLSNTDSYYYAQANYKHDHVRIACHKKSDKPTIEFEVYKSFVNEDIKSGNKKAYGKEFLARPLLSFDFNDKHCFVTSSRCDQNIAEYTRNMDPLDKATELPAIFNQIIQGIDYLHSIGWTHNHIRPSSICINTSRITKTTKVLIRYFKRASLIQYDAQYKVVQVDKYPRPYLIDSPEWISGKSMDLRELDMWNIGTTFYGVTFVWKPRNDIPLLQDTALITLEDLTSSPWEPRLMSQAKHSLVMERQKPWRHLEVLAQALLPEDQYKSLKAKVVVKPTVIALMSTFNSPMLINDSWYLLYRLVRTPLETLSNSPYERYIFSIYASYGMFILPSATYEQTYPLSSLLRMINDILTPKGASRMNITNYLRQNRLHNNVKDSLNILVSESPLARQK